MPSGSISLGRDRLSPREDGKPSRWRSIQRRPRLSDGTLQETPTRRALGYPASCSTVVELTRFVQTDALSGMEREVSAGKLEEQQTWAREADLRRLKEALASHEPALLATARFLVHEEADARDLVQQTFETALRHLDDLRDEEKLGPWLTTMAVRAASRRRFSLARFMPWSANDSAEPRSGGIDDSGIALRAAVQALPDRVRIAVVLHHMLGFSVQETATAMGVSENTIKSELKTGLSRLREAMK
jgi:RNA polymerase sigma-70 factor, ECF subfamily